MNSCTDPILPPHLQISDKEIDLLAAEASYPTIWITALHLGAGGVELALTNLANALVRRGLHVIILCIYRLGEPAYPLDPKVEVRYLTDRVPNRAAFKQAVEERSVSRILREGGKAILTLFQKRRSLIRALKTIPTDSELPPVILSTRHTHALLLTRHAPKPTIRLHWMHHDHNWNRRFLRSIRRSYGKLDAFIVLLPKLKEEFEALFRNEKRAPQIHALGNFLLPEQIPNPDKLLPNYKRPPQLAWVGRLEPEKGPFRALETFATLCAAEQEVERVEELAWRKQYRLHFLGTGSLLSSLQERARDLGIEDRVVFHGLCSHIEVLELLMMSRALILTSHTEGFGFVLLEAMACRTPIIAYDVRVAPRALVREGCNGFLIPNHSLLEYCDAMDAVLAPNPFEVLEPTAQEVLDLYSEQRIVLRFLGIIQQALLANPRLSRKQNPETDPSLLPLLQRVRNEGMEKYQERLQKHLRVGIEPKLVVTANPEILMLAQRDWGYRQILLRRETEIVPDGIGVVRACRQLGDKGCSKIPGIELAYGLLQFCAANRLRVFLYGGKPEVQEAMRARLREELPDLLVVGSAHGYGNDREQIREQIIECQPDLVLAALGAPTQERFLASCLDDLNRGILIGVGGSFDVWSGQKKRAPRWVQRVNLEWAWRLLCEPKRVIRFVRANLPYLLAIWRIRLQKRHHRPEHSPENTNSGSESSVQVQGEKE